MASIMKEFRILSIILVLQIYGMKGAYEEMGQRRESFTNLSGEGASLCLVSHPSSDGATIKIPYGINVLLH